MKARLYLLAVWLMPFALIACDAKASDGYRFEEAGWVATDLDVKVVLLPSIEALRDQYAEVNGRTLGPNEELFAFGEVNPSGSCTIYKVDSRVEYAPEQDGHELNHCIYGEWHPQQNKERAS